MNKIILTFLATFTIITLVQAQSKIKDGTVAGSSSLPNSNAILELESTNKGLLLPRLALSMTTDPSPLSAHVAGMTVYNTVTAGDVTPGFYYNDGTRWVPTKTTAIEPWNVQSTTSQATTNTQDIYQTGKVGIGAGFDATTTTKQLDVAGSFRASYLDGNYSILAETGWGGTGTNMFGAYDFSGNDGGAIFYQNYGTNTMQVIAAYPAANRQTDIQQTEDQVTISGSDNNNGPGTSVGISVQTDGNIYIHSKQSGLNPPSSTLHLDPNGWYYKHDDEMAGSPTSDTYYFPNVVGSAGQVLTTDGLNPAQLYWSDKTAALEPWNIATTTMQADSNTQNIYQTGKVGIGDGFSGAAPTHQLQVNGDFQAIDVNADTIVGVLTNAVALGGTKDMAGMISMNSNSMAFATVQGANASIGYRDNVNSRGGALDVESSQAILNSSLFDGSINSNVDLNSVNNTANIGSYNNTNGTSTSLYLDNANSSISLDDRDNNSGLLNSLYMNLADRNIYLGSYDNNNDVYTNLFLENQNNHAGIISNDGINSKQTGLNLNTSDNSVNLYSQKTDFSGEFFIHGDVGNAGAWINNLTNNYET